MVHSSKARSRVLQLATTAALFALLIAVFGHLASPASATIAINLQIQSGAPTPPSITNPIWNSSYPWQQSSGYNTWTANKQTGLPNGYEMRQGYSGRPGLWIWPIGSSAAGNRAYPPGSVEYAFQAPGTTRIARASIDVAYRAGLYNSHCTEFGLRTSAESRAKSSNCTAPTPDRVEIDSHGDTNYRNIPLFDPSSSPTAKEAYARLFIPRCDPLPESFCAKWIATQDPLNFGPYLQVRRVDLTLVDDDLPVVTNTGTLFDLHGRYIDGTQTYSLTAGASDAGAGLASLSIDRSDPQPSGAGHALASKQSSCDTLHFTASLGSRICPANDSIATQVDASTLPEGKNHFHAMAADIAGNGGQRSFDVFVDRTAPPAPQNVYFLTPAKGAAQAYWGESVDPDLADGSDGSGTSHYRFRHKVNDGAWSAWTETSRSRQLSNEVHDLPNGSVVSFDVVAVDAAGNVSPSVVSSGLVHDQDPADPATGGSGTTDTPASDVAPTPGDDGTVPAATGPSSIATGNVPIILQIQSGVPTPPSIAIPIWNSSYPWLQLSGFNTWTASKQTSRPNGYEMRQGYSGRPGLWIWPVGSSSAGNHAYPPGSVEYAFQAPGTTRIARASIDVAYRAGLYNSHCTEFGLRTSTESRAKSSNCTAPVPDRVEIDSHGDTNYRNIPLFDPASSPTAKEAYARIFIPRCDPLPESFCSKWIAAQDPLNFGPYLQVRRVDMTLVDDDLPVVTTGGAFQAVNGKYVDGHQQYAIDVVSSDAGAGIAKTQVDHVSPGGQQDVINAKPAACDPGHVTESLGARICPASDSSTTTVDTSLFAEGKNDIRAWAYDPAGNVGERRLSVLVDRTAPPVPDVRPIEPDEGSAQAYWHESVDPALSGGVPGSGTAHYRYRSRVADGNWSSWTEVSRSQQLSNEIFDQPTGTHVSFEVVAIDAVGNASSPATVALQVRGHAPSNAIGGELGDLNGRYTRGLQPVSSTTAAADDEAGVKAVDLRDLDGSFGEEQQAQCVDASQRFAVGKQTCPATFNPSFIVPFPSLSEGRHRFVSTTTDRAGNKGQSGSTVFIDRTAPSGPSSVSVDFTYNPDDGSDDHATLSWQQIVDPPLVDGSPPSGWNRDEVSYSIDGSAFSPWQVVVAHSLLISDAYPGEKITVQVRAVDNVENVGDPTTNTVTLVGPTNDESELIDDRVEKAQQFRDNFGLAQPDDAALRAMESNPTFAESQQEYGVALNPDEIAELDARVDREEEIQDLQANLLDSYPNTFSGITIDQANGGRVLIAFTQNASARVAQIAQTFSRPDLLVPVNAAYSDALLSSTYDDVSHDLEQLEADFGVGVSSVTWNVPDNRIDVGMSPYSASVASLITGRYGGQVHVMEEDEPEELASRQEILDRERAGLEIDRQVNSSQELACTAGFSAVDKTTNPRQYFVLTAGHCGSGAWTQAGVRSLGSTSRMRYTNGGHADVQGIGVSHLRTSNGLWVPGYTRKVFRVETRGRDEVIGEVVCKSGITTGVTCGKLKDREYTSNADGVKLYNLRKATFEVKGGDSGAPVYRKRRHRRAIAVGIIRSKISRALRKNWGVYSQVQRVESEMNVFICLPAREECGK